MTKAISSAPPVRPEARKALAEAKELEASDREAAVAAARRAWTWAPYDESMTKDVAAVLRELDEDDLATRLTAESQMLQDTQISRLAAWQETVPVDSPIMRARTLYLDLMERAVSNWIYGDEAIRADLTLTPFDAARRAAGRDIPSTAHSMIGLRRLRHLRRVAEDVLSEGVPGDFMECGVWRGGAVILMRAVLAAFDISNRRVWAVDSFAGLPPPDSRFEKDADTVFNFHERSELAVSVDDVRSNINRYSLLDDQIVLLKGLFCDTLPALPSLKLAILRIDGDLYSSTMDVLENMYSNVSPGGVVILDDYGVVVDSHRAVLDFRARHEIKEEMFAVDGDAVFWRKSLL